VGGVPEQGSRAKCSHPVCSCAGGASRLKSAARRPGRATATLSFYATIQERSRNLSIRDLWMKAHGDA